jgi:hypothetical protein
VVFVGAPLLLLCEVVVVVVVVPEVVVGRIGIVDWMKLNRFPVVMAVVAPAISDPLETEVIVCDGIDGFAAWTFPLFCVV